jgi:hypothetical protein
MDTYGLLSCNGKQTFTSKVVIGKGDNFKIGPIWTRAYPFDTNFQMTFYTETNATNALAELTASTREEWGATRSVIADLIVRQRG